MSDTDEILHYGHPVLRCKAEPVPRFGSEVSGLVQRLIAALERSGGLGLAAPQIGCGLCVISYDIGEGGQAVINPRIERAEGLDSSVEGCLSLPRLYGEVPRAQRVVVKGRNERGRPITIEAQDLLARVLQHEIDHLQGVLFVDRVAPETLHWLVGDASDESEPQRVQTAIEDALKVFEARLAARRAAGP